MRLGSRQRWALALLAAALLSTSCAYFNTLYLAKKYYFKGTAGLPYTVDKPDPVLAQNFPKAVDYSKKVLANYPKSKWVAYAYLLWARALLGREDPRETVNMLQDFDIRFPNNKLRAEALFYLGVGYRQSHRYTEAEAALDQYLALQPKGDLAPYAWLERSRALSSLDRDSAAAYCAGQVLDRFPKSRLGPQARAARAQALLDAGEYAEARGDYHNLGLMSRTDEERLGYLLREADCLEAGHEYDAELSMLKDAIGHEQPPTQSDTSRAMLQYRAVEGWDRYGRILMRIGTVHMLAGRQKDALDAFQEIVRLYPKSALSAEARYRIGYTFEVAGDDFARARSEYARVKDEVPGSAFAAQAQSRVANLDRVVQFRSAGGDTTQKRAEAGFLLGELYLFQLGKPDRALEEYGKVAAQFPGTPWAAKALNAQAWVLSRKLDRKAAADSLFWIVVRQYPATEAQLAARDYLEEEGITVPDTLIEPPKEPLVASSLADTTRLTAPPAGSMPLGRSGAADSVARGLGRPGSRRALLDGGGPRPAWDPRYAGGSSGAPSVAGDSPYTSSGGEGASADTTHAPAGAGRTGATPRATVPRDTVATPKPPLAPTPMPSDLPTPPATGSSPGPAPRADSTRIER